MSTSEEVKKQNKKINVFMIVTSLVLVVLAGLAVFFFTQTHNDKKTDTKAVSERIIKKVSKIYLVPESEIPTVAKIQDKSSLHDNQDFYKNAQNGDYLLVYQKNQVALLYRESINKLVKVSPIATGHQPE